MIEGVKEWLSRVGKPGSSEDAQMRRWGREKVLQVRESFLIHYVLPSVHDQEASAMSPLPSSLYLLLFSASRRA